VNNPKQMLKTVENNANKNERNHKKNQQNQYKKQC